MLVLSSRPSLWWRFIPSPGSLYGPCADGSCLSTQLRVSPGLRAHIQLSTDTSTWISNKNFEVMSKMGLLTSPRPMPAVFLISVTANHSSQLSAEAPRAVLDCLVFLTTPFPVFRVSCWFYLQSRSKVRPLLTTPFYHPRPSYDSPCSNICSPMAQQPAYLRQE